MIWPWKRRKQSPVRFSELKWDVHSHIVPGVDDGAQDMEASLEMVGHLAAMGYEGLVLTPHIMSDLYPNSKATLQPAFDRLVEAVNAAGLRMELRLAAEYLIEAETLSAIEAQDVLTFPCKDAQGTLHELILMEFGFHHPPEEALVKDVLFAAQTHGLTPLLAHCERYPYLHKNEALLDLWRKRGGWMSVNAASLVGAYGNEVKDMAHRCMKQGWVSFVCSDAHGMRHVRALESLSHSRHVAQWMEAGHCLHTGLG